MAVTTESSPASPVLGREGTAQYLNLSIQAVDNLAKKGLLPRVKIGQGPRSRVLFLKDDLDSFLRRHRQAAE